MATRKRATSIVKKEGNPDMPPPPLPQKKILEAEVNALGNCFRSAVVKTGQVYSFYADTRRLSIDNHAPCPPRSLTSSLGREVEKFDQLCDAIESRLLRATSVLKRDLIRAENRLKAAQAAEAQQPRQPSPMAGTAPPSPTHLVKSIEQSTAQSNIAGRRPSVISLSSLHRPTFPHKLDLSSLRLNPEDIISLSTGGLASPVTLAPRSARPTSLNELPPDLMAALTSSEAAAAASNTAVDIDLTLDSDPVDESLSREHPTNLDPTLGSSADKPIELDLDIDMTDMQSIFGDDPTNAADVEGLFSDPDANTTKNNDGENIEMEILCPFSSTVGNTPGTGNNIFASMDTQGSEGSNNVTGPPSTSIAPSPGSLLASLNDSSATNIPSSTSMPSAESPFDINSIDLSGIAHTFLMDSGSDMNLMEQLFSVDGDPNGPSTEGNKDG